MKGFSVLFGMTLLLSIAAMSAAGSGVRDQIDPELTREVEAMLELHPLERSPLREFAGLPPLASEPAPPLEAAPFIGAAFIERPPGIAAGAVPGYAPLTDLDALYGVSGPPVVVAPAPAFAEPPADLIDDTPAMVASVWANPPLDAK